MWQEIIRCAFAKVIFANIYKVVCLLKILMWQEISGRRLPS